MKDDAAAVAVVGGSYAVSAPRLFIPADTTRYYGNQGRLKRLVDVVVAGLALAAISPLFLLICRLIKRSSPGPVLFVQERLGRDGRPFKFYKFRSMVHNSDDTIHRQFAAMFINGDEGGCAASNSGEKVFKLKRDPRITPIGRILRKFSLDELPQLLNVLLGDMSLVGPRPPIPSEVEKYTWWQRRRVSVKPGLTCVWQVYGRNRVSFKRWVEMDLYYIDNWSLWLDIKLILHTIRVVFSGTGM